MSFVQYSNNLYLSKGLTHCFSQKLKFLKNCFFLNKISLEKVFSYFLYGNKSILDNKKGNCLMIKNIDMFKRGYPLQILKCFLFEQNSSEKRFRIIFTQQAGHSTREKCRFMNPRKIEIFQRG